MKIIDSYCHCEPFAWCHSERSEESHGAQDRLRETISLLMLHVLEIASPSSLAYARDKPRNDREK